MRAIKSLWERIGLKASESALATIIVAVLLGVYALLVSWSNGSRDGKRAYDDNNSFHPIIEQRVDSLRSCQTRNDEKIDEIMRTLDRIDNRTQKLYELLIMKQ